MIDLWRSEQLVHSQPTGVAGAATKLKSQGVPVKIANPKEGALTWVCGAMIHKDAPDLDKAHDIVDSLLSVEAGRWMIEENGYGHSNSKSFDQFDDETLASLGLTRNPSDAPLVVIQGRVPPAGGTPDRQSCASRRRDRSSDSGQSP